MKGLSLTRSGYILFFLLATLFIQQSVYGSSKIDTIYFQNGDRITGEVKSLENNTLRLSTADGGTIKLEWDRIDSVRIKNTMRIILEDGSLYFGHLAPAGKSSSCVIIDRGGNITEVRMITIVGLQPIEKKVFDRFKGTISTGISYSKASEILQFDFEGNIQYWTDKSMLEGFYNIILTSEQASELTQRQTGGATYHKLLANKWFLQGRILGESNSEFLLDLRTTLGLGGGNNIIYNSKSTLYIGSGLLINKEFSADLEQMNLEAILIFDYSLYLLDSPEIQFNFRGTLVPSFNRWGRMRSEINASLKWELVNDFYIKGSFYNSFDNMPLSGVDIRDIWGGSIGLEYKL